MMNFRIIKAAIEQILFDNSQDCFSVVGYQKQVASVEESLDEKRTVQVYYSSGDFKGRQTGPTYHDITYRIDLTVAKSSAGDLATVNSAGSGTPEKAEALADFQTGAARCDESFDELVELVYQILMDGNNLDLGQDVGVVANRWLDQVQKDQPLPRGEYVLLTGSLFFKLRTTEQISGATLTAGDVQDVTLDQHGDDFEKTEVEVNG